MEHYVEGWWWLIWLVLGAIGYGVCCAIEDDIASFSAMAVVGGCALGPFMFIITWCLYLRRRG